MPVPLTENQTDEAALRVAAKSGDSAALYRLGHFLFMKPAPERHATLEEAIKLIVDAAHEGHPDAAHLAAIIMAGDTTMQDNWEYALAYMGRAAKAGHRHAQAQFAFLGGDKDVAAGLSRGETYADDTWYRLHDAIDPKRLIAAASSQPLCPSPHVARIEGIASPAECDWIITRARPLLERAMTYNRADGGGKIGQQRTNSEALFPFDQQDLVLIALRQRIATLTGLLMHRMEPPTVLHYMPGQEFKPHYDFLDPAIPAYAANIARSGQRLFTVLVYLNDDFEGGETHFVNPNLRFKGGKGDAVLFRNVDDAGKPDFATLHAGLPTIRGEKWLFSQWLRG